MKKNIRKAKIAIFVFCVLLILFSVTCKAEEIDPTTIIKEPETGDTKTLFEVGNIILGLIQGIGAGVAVIATLVLGMKYVYSSPEDKATIKKQLIPYIIGGVLVFGATTLVKIAEALAGDIL